MLHKKLFCMFCDDVRNEMGGKHSFMGVYQDNLLFETLPGNLPFLHVVMKLSLDNTKIDFEKIRFLVTNYEGIEFDMTYDVENIRKDILSASNGQKTTSNIINIFHILRIPNLRFEKETEIKTFAFLGEKKVVGETLKISAIDLQK